MVQILLKTFSFVFIIILAYSLKRLGLFGPSDYKIVTKIALNVTLPAAVITSFASYEADIRLLLCAFIGFAMNVLVLSIAYLCSLKKRHVSRALWLNCTSGYNIGTFALPFVQGFLTPAGVVACCLFDAGSATMCAGGTYAISSAISEGKDSFSIKPILKKLLGSVPLISYVTMLVITLTGLTIPQTIVTFIEPIAKANPFMAMFMIGTMFEIKLEKGRIKDVITILLIRTAWAFLASLGCYLLLPFEEPIRQAMAIAVWAPVSVASTAFSEKAGADPADAGCLNSLSIPISIIGIIALLLIFGAI